MELDVYMIRLIMRHIEYHHSYITIILHKVLTFSKNTTFY